MTSSKPGPPSDEEPTIGRLVADTSRDLSTLIHSEIQLAKTELTFSLKAGGLGAALFAVAGFVAVLAIIMASIAFALFLDWWFAGTATAFTIVFGIYLLISAVVAWLGLKKIKQVKAPEQTIATMKSNKQVLKRG